MKDRKPINGREIQQLKTEAVKITTRIGETVDILIKRKAAFLLVGISQSKEQKECVRGIEGE